MCPLQTKLGLRNVGFTIKHKTLSSRPRRSSKISHFRQKSGQLLFTFTPVLSPLQIRKPQLGLRGAKDSDPKPKVPYRRGLPDSLGIDTQVRCTHHLCWVQPWSSVNPRARARDPWARHIHSTRHDIHVSRALPVWASSLQPHSSLLRRH